MKACSVAKNAAQVVHIFVDHPDEPWHMARSVALTRALARAGAHNALNCSEERNEALHSAYSKPPPQTGIEVKVLTDTRPQGHKRQQRFKISMSECCCESCGKVEPGMKQCQQCRTCFFCSAACQKAAWKEHKPYCVRMAKAHKESLPDDDDPSEMTEHTCFLMRTLQACALISVCTDHCVVECRRFTRPTQAHCVQCVLHERAFGACIQLLLLLIAGQRTSKARSCCIYQKQHALSEATCIYQKHKL